MQEAGDGPLASGKRSRPGSPGRALMRGNGPTRTADLAEAV